MRVCVLTTSYPLRPGDMAGRFIADECRYLAEHEGLDITVLAPGHAGAPRCEKHGRLTVRRLRYFWPSRWQRLAYGSGMPANLKSSLLAWINLPFFFAVFKWAALWYGRRADLLHAHWGILGALAVAMRPLHRRPVVVTVRGSDLRSGLRPVKWLTRWAIRRADAVTTPSGAFAEMCRTIRGREGVHFQPNGVTAPPRGEIESRRRTLTAPGHPHLVSVGRLIAERRHDNLIRALARIRPEFPEAHLTLVGDGPQRSALETLARQLGLAEAVRFAGTVPTDVVSDYLLAADLYVSPTSVDNFGNATVEGAAHALPVITTRVGFPAELVVDGQTGLIIPPEDEDALAGALGKLCGLPPEELRAMGGRMRDRFDAVGLEQGTCARRILAIYRACVDARRGRGARPA